MISGINHITLSVRSLTESFHFYSEVLGFKPLMLTSRIAYFAAGTLWFCIEEDANARTKPSDEYTHFAFSVEEHDFDQLATRIRDSGAPIWKENESEGESLYFLDPTGHKLEIHVGSWQSRIADAKKATWDKEMKFFEDFQQ